MASSPGCQPSVSIIIPTLGNPLLQACLASIQQHVPSDLPYEIVLLANGLSPDDAAALAGADRPELQVLHTSVNIGFGAACNRAAAAASGEYLVFLNDDTEVLSGWLEALVSTADAHSHAAAVGSLILFPNGSVQEAGCVVWRDGSTIGVGRGAAVEAAPYAFLRRVDYCSACSLLVRRSRFDAVGGFDARYFPAYYEDVDLCFALAGDGFDVIFDPRSRIVHHESTSSSSPRKTYLCLRHREVFRQKWGHVLDRLEPPSNGDPAALSRAVERARGTEHLLMIDDRPPQRGSGAGFSVLLDAIEEIAGNGCAVTVAVSDRHDGDVRRLADLGVHVMREPPEQVLAGRCGAFDRVLISRPHNFERYAALVRAHQPQASLVYLAEALFYRRMQRSLALLTDPGERASLTTAMLQSREMERGIPCLADSVVCVSDEEAAILAAVPGGCPIEVIRPIERQVMPTRAGFDERHGLLFTPGWLAGDPSPNVDALVWFVTEVLPIVQRSRPDIRLRVTGANPPPRVESLTSDAMDLLGFVPDLRSVYESARVVIVPMRVGSGVKVKCLEAVQHGVPVVSTPIGAEGLSLRDPRAIIIAADATAFAAAVLDLHESADAWLRQRIHIIRVAETWRTQPGRTWRDVLSPSGGEPNL